MLTLAVEWSTDRLPLAEVRRQSTDYERWTATRFTDPDDAAWSPLMRLIDALVDSDATGEEGWQYRTKHGVFTEAVIRSVGAAFHKIDGRLRITFPIRHPWDRRPDPDGTTGEEIAGVRGAPLIVFTREERMAIANEPEREVRARSRMQVVGTPRDRRRFFHDRSDA